MSSPRHIKVFVASPNDVNPERAALEHVISDLNTVWGLRKSITLQMLDWRKHVALWFGRPPERELLEQLPVQSWDLFIGIFWGRFGTPTGDLNPDTGEPFRSGTEQEFFLAYKCFQKLGKPRMLVYRCNRGIEPDKIDPDQFKLVQEFFEEFKLGGKYHGARIPYTEITEFADSIRRHLLNALMDLEEHEIPRPSLVESVNNVPENKVTQWLSKVKLVRDPFLYQQGDIDDNLPKYFHSPSSLPAIGERVQSQKVGHALPKSRASSAREVSILVAHRERIDLTKVSQPPILTRQRRHRSRSAFAGNQKIPAPFNRRLTILRTALSTAPLPIGNPFASK